MPIPHSQRLRGQTDLPPLLTTWEDRGLSLVAIVYYHATYLFIYNFSYVITMTRPETDSAHWVELSVSAIVEVRPAYARMGRIIQFDVGRYRRVDDPALELVYYNSFIIFASLFGKCCDLLRFTYIFFADPLLIILEIWALGINKYWYYLINIQDILRVISYVLLIIIIFNPAEIKYVLLTAPTIL